LAQPVANYPIHSQRGILNSTMINLQHFTNWNTSHEEFYILHIFKIKASTHIQFNLPLYKYTCNSTSQSKEI